MHRLRACGRGSHVRRAEIILSSTATLVWKLFSAVIARALSRPTCLHAARTTRSQHYWPLPVHRPLHFSRARRLPRSSSSSGTTKRFEYDCDASVKRARGACTATVRYTSRRQPTFVKRFLRFMDINWINLLLLLLLRLIDVITIRNTDGVTGPFYCIFPEHGCARVSRSY